MVLNYTKEITNRTAKMFILSDIGGMGVNAEMFTRELEFLNDSEGVEEIEIAINSPGGSVMEGMGIFTAIRESKKPVNTKVVGVAASMAGAIALAGKKRSIVNFGMIMIHPPAMGGGDVTDVQQMILDKFQDSLVTMMTEATGLTSEKIVELMHENGADGTWLNASESKSLGFVDEVFSTQASEEAAEKLQNHNFDANRIYSICNSINSHKSKNDMKNVCAALGLDANTSEADVLKKVNNLSIEVETLSASNSTKDVEIGELKASVTDLTAKNKAFEDVEASIKKTNAATLVEAAISEGKIKEDQKETLIALAVENFETVETMLSAVSVTKVANKIPVAPVAPKNEGKTFSELEKEDPSFLAELRNSDEEAYNKLFNADPAYNNAREALS